ncbi:MAG: hypothetical protein ACTSSH_00865 [Candidatus Heimdallarchaeota archaeon]
MTLCSYCEKESHATCCKCKRPVCNRHSHYKDHVFDNYYELNVAGHKYTYEIYCQTCDDNLFSFDFLKSFVAFIFVIGLLVSIASLVIRLW